MAILINGKKVAGLGAGVASGGTVGQVLTKKSNTDFDTEWADMNLDEVQGLINDHADNEEIHITQEERESWFSGDYQDLVNKPNVFDNNSSTFEITDVDGNIILRVDKDGLHTTSVVAKALLFSAQKENADGELEEEYINVLDYIRSEIAAVVNESPETLNTLKELADALGNDPNFSTTVLNLIGIKANQTQVDSIAADIAIINAQIAELMYEELAFTKLTSNVSSPVELGTGISSIKLDWASNKTPKTLTLDGASIDANLTTYTYNYDPALKPTTVTTKKYKIQGTDEKGFSASKELSISFVNGVYYGSIDKDATITNELIQKMTKKLQNSRSLSVTITPGATEYIAFAFPSRLGTPTFKMGGFETTCNSTPFSFENKSGFTETYNVYTTSQTGLGKTEVVVT